MLISIVTFPLAALAFAVSGYLVARHWQEIRLLDPLTIKEERERQKREVMIRRRFDRIRADHAQPLKRLGRRFQRRLQLSFERLEQRLQSFEQLYRQVKNPFASLAPSSRERVKTLLAEARSLARDLKWADAERRYLEVLSLDAHHVEAYKGLGQIYLKQKLYPQAKETYEFVLKMKKADDATYAGLAEIATAAGDLGQAETMHVKAADSSPKQAHRHFELAEFYVDRQQFDKAWEPIKRASGLDPGSVKYLELSLEIALQINDVKEARQRYQRLRLLLDDKSRIQIWKERLERRELQEDKERKKKN